MAQAFRETTVWEGPHQPNHLYLLDGDKMLAYVPQGGTKAVYFKSPITISKRKRTFVAVRTTLFRVPKSTSIVVQGSKGKVYYVNPEEKTCSCPGYTYHGTCKHLKNILES